MSFTTTSEPPPLTFAQSYTKVRAMRALSKFDERYDTFSALSIVLSGVEYLPALSLYPATKPDWQNDREYVTEAPLLAIEILAFNQLPSTIMPQVEGLLENGVPVCWILQPEHKALIIVEPNLKPRVITSGVVLDKATGISVTIEDIFR
jgi:Uma2 family endonuclease